mgnify:CR=1 FL=1
MLRRGSIRAWNGASEEEPVALLTHKLPTEFFFFEIELDGDDSVLDFDPLCCFTRENRYFRRYSRPQGSNEDALLTCSDTFWSYFHETSGKAPSDKQFVPNVH